MNNTVKGYILLFTTAIVLISCSSKKGMKKFLRLRRMRKLPLIYFGISG